MIRQSTIDLSGVHAMSNAEEKPRAPSSSDVFHDHCNMEQKECLDNCTTLYHFASNDLHKFSILHQVFGACNVVKLIQNLPSDQRVDAINSMVYEASARLQDPAFGCAGIIRRLQLQISDLESQITATQGKIQKVCSQQAQLLASIPGFNNKFDPTISTSVNDADDKDEELFDSNLSD